MPEVSATDAARNFSDLLDAVEHRGEHFTIVRRGKVVAQLDPRQAGRGAEIKALLQRHRRDSAFARDLTSARDLLQIENRP
jgi:prevent-host-death family protein